MTDVQKSILNCLADALTAREMASHLNIPVRTINFHLQVLYSLYNLPPGKGRNIKLLSATGYIQKPSPIE
jgi:predicted ArsR family transcriptional regulator